ncbi:hypothetical protein TNCV_1899321 [Trichonephila clavipes]|nr:hypothetical protein TNCV_1899321 [Trichonephila clavipes]
MNAELKINSLNNVVVILEWALCRGVATSMSMIRGPHSSMAPKCAMKRSINVKGPQKRDHKEFYYRTTGVANPESPLYQNSMGALF